MKTVIKVKNGFVYEILSEKEDEFFVFDYDTEDLMDEVLFQTEDKEVFISQVEQKKIGSETIKTIEKFNEKKLLNKIKTIFDKGSE